MKGTIKWYNDMRGYGFIAGEDEKEVFIHRTAVPAGESLNEGDQVEYEIENSERGLKATNVKKLNNT
jgi:CspA family cold shock protein